MTRSAARTARSENCARSRSKRLVPLSLNVGLGAGGDLLRVAARLLAGLLADPLGDLRRLGHDAAPFLSGGLDLLPHGLFGLGAFRLHTVGLFQAFLDPLAALVQHPRDRLVQQEVQHRQQDGEVDDLGDQTR